MDDITIDENYDAVKEEFFKGLTFRQTVYAFLTILGGTATYTILLMVLHLPQIAALYLAVLIAVPVAANGFVEIHGLTKTIPGDQKTSGISLHLGGISGFSGGGVRRIF